VPNPVLRTSPPAAGNRIAWVAAFVVASLTFAFEAVADRTIDLDSTAAAASRAVTDSGSATQGDTTASVATPEPSDRPSVIERAKNGTLHLLSDTWWVFSSPARLNRHSALGTGVVLATTAALYAYDQDLYDATQRNRDQQPLKGLMDFADLYVPIGFMPDAFKIEAGVALVGYAFRSEPLRQIPIECIESHLIAGTLRNILKPLVGRAHPYEELGPRHFEFNEGTSFPSGHTSIFFEIATVVSEHVHSTPVTAGLYTLAALGAVQRVESQNHWPSDVFFPAVTGTLIARTIVRRNAARREQDRVGVSTLQDAGWTPMLAVHRDGVRISVRRGL
jgi:membrane-associated phospholipid phosphatase